MNRSVSIIGLYRKRPILAVFALSLATGCVSQEQYDASLRINADLQRENDSLKKQLADRQKVIEDNTTRLRQLEQQAATLQAQVSQAAITEGELRKSLEAARVSLEKAMSASDTEMERLRRSMEESVKARTQWEEELAERARQIDMLQSQLTALRRELVELRKKTATQPGASP
jgi:chromosome segregation ATPase